MPETYCMVLTTTNDDATKTQMVEALLSARLAACVQCLPIESHYLWQDQLCHEVETLLVIKTTDRCYKAIERLVSERHNYQTPQIIKLPFCEGANPYLTWLRESTEAKTSFE